VLIFLKAPIYKIYTYALLWNSVFTAIFAVVIIFEKNSGHRLCSQTLILEGLITLSRKYYESLINYNDFDLLNVDEEVSAVYVALKPHLENFSAEVRSASNYSFSEEFFSFKHLSENSPLLGSKNNFYQFVRVMQTIVAKCDRPALYLITGKAGIGKTTFFDHINGLCLLLEKHGYNPQVFRDQIHMIDFHIMEENDRNKTHSEEILAEMIKRASESVNANCISDFNDFIAANSYGNIGLSELEDLGCFTQVIIAWMVKGVIEYRQS